MGATMSYIFILLIILQHNNFQPIINSSNGAEPYVHRTLFGACHQASVLLFELRTMLTEDGWCINSSNFSPTPPPLYIWNYPMSKPLMPRWHQIFCSVLDMKLLGIMLRNRCWSTTFLTITVGDANGWCRNWPMWSTPQPFDTLLLIGLCARFTSNDVNNRVIL